MASKAEGVVDGARILSMRCTTSASTVVARQAASEARAAHQHSDPFLVCRPLDRGHGNDRLRRCIAIGAPRADRPHARRNLSFGKLACRLIGGAGSGTVGIEEATMHTTIPLPVPCKRAPWNKGRLIGQKRPLKPKDVWAIRVRLQLQGRKRDLALFNLAIDSKLRGCDLVRLQVDDVCAGGRVRDRGTVIQKKTGRPVQFALVPPWSSDATA
jgi:hypothetical protein